MISIIICSRTPDIPGPLKINIETTIGVPHEIIVVDNSANKFSIFEAYNAGVKKSQFPYLCFMHDDIYYHTNNWGITLLKHFEDERTGAIGIAGSPYAPAMVGSWWGGRLVNQFILPAGNNNGQPRITATQHGNEKNEVVVLDGVWMCIRAKLFNQIRFDDNNYNGYHFYDVDISLQIRQCGYKLFSIFNVLITHYSTGNMSSNWYENAVIFQKKWRSLLPASCVRLTYAQAANAEFKTLAEYVHVLTFNGVPAKKIYRQAIWQIFSQPYWFFYYKTPAYLLKYLLKFLSAKIFPAR